LLLAFTAGAAGPLPAQAPLPQPPRGPAAYVLLAPLEADRAIAAVRAADDERLGAIRAGDVARLDAILSDDLRYAHSNGKVDTKDSLTKSLASRSLVYESFDYREINYRAASPGVVLMAGRVVIHASSAGQKAVLDLNFLAVWREENGRWRFLAWQSARNPPPPAQ
jgi:ketosteroid isomerase-like protein